MCLFNPLHHMPILGFSNSVANKDMIAKLWTYWDTIICLSRKHCGKRRNCSLRAISPFPIMFSKAVCCRRVKTSIYGVKGYKLRELRLGRLRMKSLLKSFTKQPRVLTTLNKKAFENLH